jgi:hypothetical protein
MNVRCADSVPHCGHRAASRKPVDVLRAEGNRDSDVRQVEIAQRADSKPSLRSAASIAPASLAGFFNGAVEYEEFPMISACLCWTVMGMIRRSWGWQNAATGKISATAIFIRTEVDARLALL